MHCITQGSNRPLQGWQGRDVGVVIVECFDSAAEDTHPPQALQGQVKNTQGFLIPPGPLKQPSISVPSIRSNFSLSMIFSSSNYFPLLPSPLQENMFLLQIFSSFPSSVFLLLSKKIFSFSVLLLLHRNICFFSKFFLVFLLLVSSPPQKDIFLLQNIPPFTFWFFFSSK